MERSYLVPAIQRTTVYNIRSNPTYSRGRGGRLFGEDLIPFARSAGPGMCTPHAVTARLRGWGGIETLQCSETVGNARDCLPVSLTVLAVEIWKTDDEFHLRTS